MTPTPTPMSKRRSLRRHRADCTHTGAPRSVSWRAIATVTGTATLCAIIAWAFVGPIAGVTLAVHDGAGAREVGVVSVIVSTVLIAAAGGVLLRWWQRRSSNGTRNWSILALAVAVISLLGPTGADTLPAGMALVSLHAVVATVVIIGLTRSRRC